MRIERVNVEFDDERQLCLVREGFYVGYKVNAYSQVCMLMRDKFKLHLRPEEYVYILATSTDMSVRHVFELAHGTVNATLLSPREVFLRLLAVGAASFIFVHNHPSGSIVPSKEDISVTKRLLEAGELLGIRLADSIIIGGDNQLSMREQEILRFS